MSLCQPEKSLFLLGGRDGVKILITTCWGKLKVKSKSKFKMKSVENWPKKLGTSVPKTTQSSP